MENKDAYAKRLGSRVREMRKQVDFTLKRLAKETGLSPPLLSQIENGVAMPSIPTLQAIADAMAVDIGYFFQNREEKGHIISYQGDRRTLVSERGYEVELLAEATESELFTFMEPAIITHKRKIDDFTHEGQEFMYILEGRVELTFGSKRYILKKGDAAYWDGSLPHKNIGLSKKPARTLNVHLIPGKRSGTFKTRNQNSR